MDQDKICVNTIALNAVKANVGSIVVDVHGLGDFDSLLNTLTHELMDANKP